MAMSFLKRPGVFKIARIVGYVVFGLVIFSVSFVMTLPEQRVKAFIEARLSKGDRVVRIDDLSIKGLGSVRMTGVEVSLAPFRAENPDGSERVEPRKLNFDSVDLSVGLFSLIGGTLSIEASIEDEGGVLGPVHVKMDDERIVAEVEEIRDFPLPQDFPLFGVHIAGTLTEGSASLDYSLEEGLAESTGKVSLKGQKLWALQPTLTSKAAGSVTLTNVNIGDMDVVLNLDSKSNISMFKSERRAKSAQDHVFHVEKFEVDGRDVKALIEGHSLIRLLPKRGLTDGQMSIEIAFALSEGFFTKKNKDSGDLPNRFLKTLLDMDPRWRNAKSGNYYGVICSGSLGRPSCIPKKPSIRGGDFKPPEKEEAPLEEKGKASREKSKIQSQGADENVRIERSRPNPRVNTVAPVITPAPLPPTQAPTPPVESEQTGEPPVRIEVNHAIESSGAARNIIDEGMDSRRLEGIRSAPLMPTVIGRSRFRNIRGPEGDLENGAEASGEEPVAPTDQEGGTEEE